MQCPKCGTEARDVARFCPRCHATLRYECPACHHEQRQGGKCEKCGVDFLKYLSAMVSAEKAQSDRSHVNGQRRSSLIRGLLLAPFDMGWSLIRGMRSRARGD